MKMYEFIKLQCFDSDIAYDCVCDAIKYGFGAGLNFVNEYAIDHCDKESIKNDVLKAVENCVQSYMDVEVE